jgi:SLOG cluster4 family
VLASANELGRAIAAAGHILLTGGPGRDSVRGSAIDGAGSKPWIGVEKEGPVDAEEVGSGLVIRTGLGHKRNYVEACMCDAAVALPGGDGTVSEVTSALSLGRPVAFVGEWRTDVDVSSVLKEIVNRTRKRFGNPTGTDGINAPLAEDVLLHSLDPLPPYQYFELPEAGAVLEWIESEVPGPAPFAGAFRRSAGLDEVAPRYERWLEQHDP